MKRRDPAEGESLGNRRPRAIAGYCQFGRAELATETDRCWDDTILATLLFADVQGFGQLSDLELPQFLEQFLGRVAELVQPHEDAILVRETWGDGLFFAMDSVQAAGNLALELSELVNGTPWRMCGFSRPLPMRIALHVGPVHLGKNPITGLASCTGADVRSAARLEPKTPPGQVFASEAFAAFAKVEQVEGFACHFVKQIYWAKHFGKFPTYVVRRTSANNTSSRCPRESLGES